MQDIVRRALVCVVIAGFFAFFSAAPAAARPIVHPRAVLVVVDQGVLDAIGYGNTVAELARLEAERVAERLRLEAAAAQAARRARWQPLAVCETSGDWTMTGSTFSGGIGFANTTWQAFGGGAYAPLAGQASIDDQITVGERVRDAAGPSAWDGCAPKVPRG